MIVDAHIHVWRALPGYPHPAVTTVSPVSDVPVELFCEYMAEHGVDRAVLVQPVYPGEDNSYIADCAAAWPDRFAAVCVVDPRMGEAARRLEYWVTQRGCKGLRLRPRLAGEEASFGDPATFPLWDRARSLRVVVSVLADPKHLPALTRLVQRFPEVAVVLDHMGHAAVQDGASSDAFRSLLHLAQFPQVFVKLSGFYYFSRQAYPYADCAEAVRSLVDGFGANRLLWGSDFPHVLLKVGYQRTLRVLQRACPFLSSAERELIMGETAHALYWGN
jgi:predicted TIM-barrel fold metal-dependent hydrolase